MHYNYYSIQLLCYFSIPLAIARRRLEVKKAVAAIELREGFPLASLSLYLKWSPSSISFPKFLSLDLHIYLCELSKTL